MYTIIPSPKFDRAYAKLTRETRAQVRRALDLLRENPHHPSLRVHKRRGEGELWQARVTREYRLYFEMQGEEIRLISVVAHEK